jgi:hypothetical protein
MLRTGDCETTEVQSAGALEVVDGRLEGTVSIPMNLVTELPHSVVVFPGSDTLADPLVCVDTTLAEEG